MGSGVSRQLRPFGVLGDTSASFFFCLARSPWGKVGLTTTSRGHLLTLVAGSGPKQSLSSSWLSLMKPPPVALFLGILAEPCSLRRLLSFVKR